LQHHNERPPPHSGTRSGKAVTVPRPPCSRRTWSARSGSSSLTRWHWPNESW